ncbi:hypothetical protein B0H63DRAFT_447587 [Podospora didyma]|uniref:Uncharacterized protein n=1 Tax=Podospora didyma TaxID=330526 RepID=A0AAE0NS35_9PEZI|nr:hypothetical protein B0H63DRAFT_447587 [Podospora didyma]
MRVEAEMIPRTEGGPVDDTLLEIVGRPEIADSGYDPSSRRCVALMGDCTQCPGWSLSDMYCDMHAEQKQLLHDVFLTRYKDLQEWLKHQEKTTEYHVEAYNMYNAANAMRSVNSAIFYSIADHDDEDYGHKLAREMNYECRENHVAPLREAYPLQTPPGIRSAASYLPEILRADESARSRHLPPHLARFLSRGRCLLHKQIYKMVRKYKEKGWETPTPPPSPPPPQPVFHDWGDIKSAPTYHSTQQCTLEQLKRQQYCQQAHVSTGSAEYVYIFCLTDDKYEESIHAPHLFDKTTGVKTMVDEGHSKSDFTQWHQRGAKPKEFGINSGAFLHHPINQHRTEGNFLARDTKSHRLGSLRRLPPARVS